jgi:hypothetical protein
MRPRKKAVHCCALSLLASVLATPLGAQERKSWSFGAGLYGLASGMTGDLGIGPVNADLDMKFNDIWDNLELGAMGKFRAGYGRWSIDTDVIFMRLGMSKSVFSADIDQWMVEPSLNFRFNKYVEASAGVRYNSYEAEIRGPGILPDARVLSGRQNWWDPVVGLNLTLPFARRFSFNVGGDIGGFGVGSDFTWQAFPYFNWQISETFSVQAGYRLINTDYESGSGLQRFKYAVLSYGPQVGATFKF